MCGKPLLATMAHNNNTDCGGGSLDWSTRSPEIQELWAPGPCGPGLSGPEPCMLHPAVQALRAQPWILTTTDLIQGCPFWAPTTPLPTPFLPPLLPTQSSSIPWCHSILLHPNVHLRERRHLVHIHLLPLGPPPLPPSPATPPQPPSAPPSPCACPCPCPCPRRCPRLQLVSAEPLAAVELSQDLGGHEVVVFLRQPGPGVHLFAQ